MVATSICREYISMKQNGSTEKMNVDRKRKRAHDRALGYSDAEKRRHQQREGKRRDVPPRQGANPRERE